MHIKIYYRSSDGEIFQNGKHCIIIALILNFVDIFLVSTSVAKAQINSSRVFQKNAHIEKWLYLHFLFCHWQLGMIIFYIIYFFQFTYPGVIPQWVLFFRWHWGRQGYTKVQLRLTIAINCVMWANFLNRRFFGTHCSLERNIFREGYFLYLLL